MKDNIVNKITNIMKNIVLKGKETVYINNDSYTAKYDVKNEFIFVSLSNENLENCYYSTYCDTTLFNDVSMYDLECLEDYDNNDLNNIYDLLVKFNEV